MSNPDNIDETIPATLRTGEAPETLRDAGADLDEETDEEGDEDEGDFEDDGQPSEQQEFEDFAHDNDWEPNYDDGDW